jgi:arsenate reductase (glutaredoxin)
MNKTIKIYGIKNCDTMKKTFLWFDEQQIAYTFHNYKTDGIETIKIKNWLSKISLNELVNKKGTTYKQLSNDDKNLLENKNTALKLIQENTSIIKRPLIEWNDSVLLGFQPEVWASLIK